MTPDEKKDEWLQFMEFIKRKYGSNSSEYIRINDYNNRSDSSVAVYYSNKNPDLNIPTDTALNVLLKNETFIKMLDLDNPIEISKFTEIYNDTDYLMRSLNTKDDNLYIQCNPVDDNGVLENTTNNNSGSGVSSVLTEGADFFSPAKLYNNVGLQVFLSLLLVGVTYAIGKLVFVVYPGTAMGNFVSSVKSRIGYKKKEDDT